MGALAGVTYIGESIQVIAENTVHIDGARQIQLQYENLLRFDLAAGAHGRQFVRKPISRARNLSSGLLLWFIVAWNPFLQLRMASQPIFPPYFGGLA